MLLKLIIVLVPVFFVTRVMDINGYSLVSQMVVAAGIGAFLGIVDAISSSKNDGTGKTP